MDTFPTGLDRDRQITTMLDHYHLLMLSCASPWAAIVDQPCNSIIISRVQLGQATSQLCQRTGTDDVRHTPAGVGLSPSLPAAGTTMTLRSVEAIQERPVVNGGQNQVVGLWCRSLSES